MGVDSLGYVAFNVADFDRWRTILTQVFGMEPRARDGSDALDFRIDENHHRITLYPTGEDSVAVVGWEVGSIARLEELAAELRSRGVELTAGTPAQCKARKVRQLYHYTCPVIGCPTDIYYGPLVSHTPFAPSRGVAGYKTGELGLGHIAFWVKDLKATLAFYQEVMGFAISDYIAWDDNDAVFLHCNARHHTLALMAEAEGRPGGKFQHLMVESTSLDDVGYGYDIVRDLGVPVAIEPGKHSNDHMQSFYLKSPSGFWVEYGYGGREIGPDWEVKNYDQPMLWGHRMVGN
ncbi:VOC family protein [Novosphingobium sp.]|uniref:VOC family protein n=1 Tax=Novosphingobium sp. TaxID=1874826 RepID=UPI0027323D80|nr:VOC family protein [Novosphingobium sp.]MDP3908527.1 VOC family protein [Novosphingobium sp.]